MDHDPARPEITIPIANLRARAYVVPTDAPEADGTFAWDKTTLIVAEIEAGGLTGIGYTYADASIVRLIDKTLAPVLAGGNVMDIPGLWLSMRRAVRNLGFAGLAATAIAALDGALWDLKAKLLGLPLALLLGRLRDAVPVYGSGGFTSYDDATLARQLAGWAEAGCRWVKMKVGQDPERDPARVAAARQAIGAAIGLFVDGNGAYSRSEAARLADIFADHGVLWFEEPVSSDDLAGLALLRATAPAGMRIAAGEYGYDIDYFRTMLAAGAVDVQQADATRCGITGFLQAAVLCDAHHTPLSAHCGPAMHRHVACAAPRLWHLEWFHDHARIEAMLFDGAPRVEGGVIRPDWSRPGLGIALKERDAEPYRAA